MSCKVSLVGKADTNVAGSTVCVFLGARFSAVTFQWSKRLPKTSGTVHSYLAHTDASARELPVSREQLVIIQRNWCPCQ